MGYKRRPQTSERAVFPVDTAFQGMRGDAKTCASAEEAGPGWRGLCASGRVSTAQVAPHPQGEAVRDFSALSTPGTLFVFTELQYHSPFCLFHE